MFWLVLKGILYLALFVALVLGGFIAYATATNYNPEEKETVELKGPEGIETVPVATSLEAFIWNIGYCGLGREVDFFYDGGKNVITPEKYVDKNIAGLRTVTAANKSADFLLYQEVDINSKRSHFKNQREVIEATASGHNHGLALNYLVKHIPIPFTEPMGKVESGLLSLSKYKSIENTRYQFPGNFPWPKSMFFLDRCFLLQRFKTSNNKELVIINTHNSAYDNGGLKKGQMEYLRKLLIDEYEKENYVIVGGDWNQTAPGFDNNKFAKPNGQAVVPQIPIEADYIPGWQWVYDENIATNRKTSHPYNAATTFTTIIDFYLLSPNLEVESVSGINIDFDFSDHQPVKLKFSLKE